MNHLGQAVYQLRAKLLADRFHLTPLIGFTGKNHGLIPHHVAGASYAA